MSTTKTVPQAELWTVAETAAYLRRPVKTLYQWRYRGVGPTAHKVGRALLYKADEVHAWLDQQAEQRER